MDAEVDFTPADAKHTVHRTVVAQPGTANIVGFSAFRHDDPCLHLLALTRYSETRLRQLVNYYGGSLRSIMTTGRVCLISVLDSGNSYSTTAVTVGWDWVLSCVI